MNNDIKEILRNLEYTAKKHTIQLLENGGMIEHCPQAIATEMRLNTYSANILLDYITNLEQKNQDYKSRNEKAIKLLKEAGCYDEETKTFCDDVWEELPKLLNILLGEDKDE